MIWGLRRRRNTSACQHRPFRLLLVAHSTCHSPLLFVRRSTLTRWRLQSRFLAALLYGGCCRATIFSLLVPNGILDFHHHRSPSGTFPGSSNARSQAVTFFLSLRRACLSTHHPLVAGKRQLRRVIGHPRSGPCLRPTRLSQHLLSSSLSPSSLFPETPTPLAPGKPQIRDYASTGLSRPLVTPPTSFTILHPPSIIFLAFNWPRLAEA
jgi:hypothetical protein